MKSKNLPPDPEPEGVLKAEADVQLTEYEKKLRRKVEDRIRKDRDALYLVARVLNIS